MSQLHWLQRITEGSQGKCADEPGSCQGCYLIGSLSVLFLSSPSDALVLSSEGCLTSTGLSDP